MSLSCNFHHQKCLKQLSEKQDATHLGQLWPAKTLHSGTEQTLTQRRRERPRRAARSSRECQAVMTKQFAEKIELQQRYLQQLSPKNSCHVMKLELFTVMTLVNYSLYVLINCLLPVFSWEALSQLPIKPDSSSVQFIGERIKTHHSNTHTKLSIKNTYFQCVPRYFLTTKQKQLVLI